MIWDVHPGSGFFASRIRGSKKHSNPDPEHRPAPWIFYTYRNVQRCSLSGNITFLKYDLEFNCHYNVKLIVLTNNTTSSINLCSLNNAANQQINTESRLQILTTESRYVRCEDIS